MSTISNIILGIGNKGTTYEGTRHNIGFDVVEALAKKADTLTACSFEHSVASIATFGEQTTLLMKPTTYVNLSGEAASEALERFELPAEKLMVVVDDFHLAVGSLRLRRKGSAGGHNGLKSLIECCGNEFHRLRYGIGPLPENTEIIDFVLGLFQNDEITTVKETTDRATLALLSYLREGMDRAMNQFNS